MARLLGFSLASALVVLACGGGVESAPANGAPSGGVDCSATADYCSLRCSGKETPLYPAQCALPGCSCLVGITPRSEWAGTYYLPQNEAINLLLEADGTFRWTIDGCSFQGGDCGTWKRSQPHTIVLLPSPGASEFQFVSATGLGPMKQVNVVGDPSGDLVMELSSPGAKPLAQRWKPGRTCAVCDGGTTPSGQTQCTTPVERRCH